MKSQIAQSLKYLSGYSVVEHEDGFYLWCNRSVLIIDKADSDVVVAAVKQKHFETWGEAVDFMRNLVDNLH